ncbi:MAG: hypothetical protein ACYCTB_11465 [bacterium]
MSNLLTSKTQLLPTLKSYAVAYLFLNNIDDDLMFLRENPVPRVLANLLEEILNKHGFFECNLFKKKSSRSNRIMNNYINDGLDTDLDPVFYIQATEEGFVIVIDYKIYSKTYSLDRIKRYFPGFSKVDKEFRLRFVGALDAYAIKNMLINLRDFKGRNVIGKVINKINDEYLISIIGFYYINNAKCYYAKEKKYFNEKYIINGFLPVSKADRNFECDYGTEYEFNLEKVIIKGNVIKSMLSRVNKNFIKCILERELQTYVKVLAMGVSEKRNFGPVRYVVVRSQIKPDLETQRHIKYILGMNEEDVIDYKLFPFV